MVMETGTCNRAWVGGLHSIMDHFFFLVPTIHCNPYMTVTNKSLGFKKKLGLKIQTEISRLKHLPDLTSNKAFM